jgi:hypothetical protein
LIAKLVRSRYCGRTSVCLIGTSRRTKCENATLLVQGGIDVRINIDAEKIGKSAGEVREAQDRGVALLSAAAKAPTGPCQETTCGCPDPLARVRCPKQGPLRHLDKPVQ